MNRTISRIAVIAALAFAATAQAGAIHDNQKGKQKQEKPVFDHRFDSQKQKNAGPYDAGRHVIKNSKFRDQVRKGYDGIQSQKKTHDGKVKQHKPRVDREDCKTDVPEPAGLALVGAGLIGIALIRRRRQARAGR